MGVVIILDSARASKASGSETNVQKILTDIGEPVEIDFANSLKAENIFRDSDFVGCTHPLKMS